MSADDKARNKTDNQKSGTVKKLVSRLGYQPKHFKVFSRKRMILSNQKNTNPRKRSPKKYYLAISYYFYLNQIYLSQTFTTQNKKSNNKVKEAIT